MDLDAPPMWLPSNSLRLAIPSVRTLALEAGIMEATDEDTTWIVSPRGAETARIGVPGALAEEAGCDTDEVCSGWDSTADAVEAVDCAASEGAALSAATVACEVSMLVAADGSAATPALVTAEAVL